ncbi:MAG: hypothetical protein SGI84_04530 [Gemmatimonadota bacterium]|nr:hypothetical protein [Gemmatimonadota bacterium]
MRALRFVLRMFGWLLTPLVAWAASFLGAVLGAALAGSLEGALNGVAVTVAMGLIFAMLGTHAWLRLVRRSPEIRAALSLEADGTPIIKDEPAPESPQPAQLPGPEAS